jgi:hypothetical protein
MKDKLKIVLSQELTIDEDTPPKHLGTITPAVTVSVKITNEQKNLFEKIIKMVNNRRKSLPDNPIKELNCFAEKFQLNQDDNSKGGLWKTISGQTVKELEDKLNKFEIDNTIIPISEKEEIEIDSRIIRALIFRYFNITNTFTDQIFTYEMVKDLKDLGFNYADVKEHIMQYYNKLKGSLDFLKIENLNPLSIE